MASNYRKKWLFFLGLWVAYLSIVVPNAAHAEGKFEMSLVCNKYRTLTGELRPAPAEEKPPSSTTPDKKESEKTGPMAPAVAPVEAQVNPCKDGTRTDLGKYAPIELKKENLPMTVALATPFGDLTVQGTPWQARQKKKDLEEPEVGDENNSTGEWYATVLLKSGKKKEWFDESITRGVLSTASTSVLALNRFESTKDDPDRKECVYVQYIGVGCRFVRKEIKK